ncbi:hypothetical protein Trydic_g19417 [Trypoxylus dichotomus]
MSPLAKIGLIAAIIATTAVGLTLTVVFVAAPISVKDVCEDVLPPTTFSVTSLPGSFFFTWGRPTVHSSCQINYELFMYNNEKLISYMVLYSNQYIYPVTDIPSCSTYRFELITISNEQYKTEAVTIYFDTDLEAVASLIVIGDSLHWSANNINTNCVFQVDINGEIIATNLSSFSYDIADLSFCKKHRITVTPVNFNGTVGIPSSIDVKKNIPFPSDVTKEQIAGHTMLVTWDHTRYKSCHISYILDGNAYEPNESMPGNQTIDISALAYCTVHILRMSFSSPSKSVEDSLNFTKPLIIPEEIFTIDSDTVNITWDYTLYQLCRVQINLDEEPINEATPGNHLLPLSDFEYCTKHIAQVIFADETGGSSDQEKQFTFARPANISDDLKLTVSNTIAHLNWNNTGLKDCAYNFTSSDFTINIVEQNESFASIGGFNGECKIYEVTVLLKDQLERKTDEKSFRFSPFQMIEQLNGTLNEVSKDDVPTTNIVEISMTTGECNLLPEISYSCVSNGESASTMRDGVTHSFINCPISIGDIFWMSIKPTSTDAGTRDISVYEVDCFYKWDESSTFLEIDLQESGGDKCPAVIMKGGNVFE